MANLIYVRKSTILISAILFSLVLSGSIIGFVLWVNHDKKYGFGEIVVQKDEDFERMYHFPGSGTSSDPYIIADLNINTNKDYAIYISWTTKHFVIRNCTIRCTNDGIYVRYAADGTAQIENNNIQPRNSITSHSLLIFIVNSPGIEIINNDLLNPYEVYDDDGLIIRDTENSWIANNSCSSLRNSIDLLYSDSTLIEFNFVESCTSGIELWSCDNSIIRYNNLIFNENSGVVNSYSTNCIYHHNNFFNNSLTSYYDKQAFDNRANTWYDANTKQGNFWSDLIWDDSAVYSIRGDGNCEDIYPLQHPVVI